MTGISPFVAVFSIKFSCASYPPPREMELSTFKIGRIPFPRAREGGVGGGVGKGQSILKHFCLGFTLILYHMFTVLFNF